MPPKKSNNPLANWPGGAKPSTAENLQKNIKEAKARHEVCMAKKSAAWHRVMEASRDGFIQYVTQYRDEADKEGVIAIKLERLIEFWEHRLDEVKVAPVAARATSSIVYHNPDPWTRAEQERVAGG